MKIGFIGTGIVSRSVARSALDHGHEVVLGSRRSRQDLDAAVTPCSILPR